MGVSDVNGGEVFAAPDDPIYKLLRVLNRQKRIHEYCITLVMNERHRIGYPFQMLAARRNSPRGARTLLGEKLPFQLRHGRAFPFSVVRYRENVSMIALATSSEYSSSMKWPPSK